MSKMVTLKTSQPHRFGKGVILAGIEVKFDVFGMTDVMERHAESLIAAGLDLVDEEDLIKYAEQKKNYEENGNIVPEIDVIDENTKLKAKIEALNKEIKELKLFAEGIQKEKKIEPDTKKEDLGIDSMKINDLKELCKSVDLPKEEWENLKINELKSYLKSKLEA